ncbi:hypothetical protein HanXRQr2_Chr16g0756951 [Helianthus annuus]|uniref:Uncharacterized protein n=1 Tax=Helianthus annuus TaxID=4232 RepID=A0A9K3GZC4_HELAN|nr:hypothetical protein HanXRQr2_Chr16g0756951 [Helianthus annuus]KAJ0821886.1 hypothetical protein HanPSC8_Chr16g0725461 [Helianthus annuus]
MQMKCNRCSNSFGKKKPMGVARKKRRENEGWIEIVRKTWKQRCCEG